MKREIAPPAERLAGIEWMRALAAFGVIAIPAASLGDRLNGTNAPSGMAAESDPKKLAP
jgi:peptidoglycan/LPS O-acetylase OafA/YrhL